MSKNRIAIKNYVLDLINYCTIFIYYCILNFQKKLWCFENKDFCNIYKNLNLNENFSIVINHTNRLV